MNSSVHNGRLVTGLRSVQYLIVFSLPLKVDQSDIYWSHVVICIKEVITHILNVYLKMFLLHIHRKETPERNNDYFISELLLKHIVT